MMSEQQPMSSPPLGLPALKKARLQSDTDVLAGLLDLPDEINEVGAGPFQVTPPTNNIDQQPLDISTTHQAPPNMATPPLNNIGLNMGSPSPSNMGGAQLNSHLLGNATPPPNAIVSTSGDPTPPLPQISASPSHSVSSSPMVPTANMGAGGGPMYNHMYHRPLMHHHGMGGSPMDGRLPSYNMGPPPHRHYNPGMAQTARYMVNPYSPHMAPLPHHGHHPQGSMGGIPPGHHHTLGGPTHHHQGMSNQGMINEGTAYHHSMVQPPPPMQHMYHHHTQGNPQQGAHPSVPTPPPTNGPQQSQPPLQQQQPVPSGPPGGVVGGPATSASNDPEKRKLIQQQLVLLLHAHRCQQREREQQAHGTFRTCELPHCRTMKNVLNHMTECQAGRDCIFPHCASSRQIIYHWKSCTQQECPVCLPLKTPANRGVSNVPLGPTNMPNKLLPTVVGGHGNYPSHSMIPNQGGNFPPNSLSHGGPVSTAAPTPPPSTSQPPSVGGVNPSSVPPPPGGVSSMNRLPPQNDVRIWHAEVNSDLRNHLIKKLVEAIYPVPHDQQQHSTDARITSLYQYAVRVEKAMFETANSREDYYQKLAEKIYRVRKELEEKRPKKQGSINGVPIDDPSHGSAPGNLPQGSPFGGYPSNPSLPLPPTPISDPSNSFEQNGTSSNTRLMNNNNSGGPLSISESIPSPNSLDKIKEELKCGSSKFNTITPNTYTPAPSFSPKKEEGGSIPNLPQCGKPESMEMTTSVPPTRTPATPNQSGPVSNKMRRESVTDSNYLSQATPTHSSPLPTSLPVEEKATPTPKSGSKIKPDPSLVKIFTRDELEAALLPIFNEVYNDPEALPFRKPVNPEELGIPDYFDIIKNPIDLSNIEMKLIQGEYTDAWEFCNDMQLMFDNAWTYNKKTSRVYKSCSKVAEVFYEGIDQAMISLGYCCGQKRVFHPQVLYCYGKLCPIPRDSPYYGCQNNRYVYCTKCFTEMPGDNISVSNDGTSSNTLPKGAFKEMKNDSVGVEPMVECIHCKRLFHKICVLYHEGIWPEGYQCNNCLRALQKNRKENRFVAKRLPSTRLGSFLENRVNTFLRHSGVNGADVTIRVVSSSNKFLDTRYGMVERFSYFPQQFPYRTKALFVFEEIDGTEVCFFGMHVQEYGSDCPAPNTRRVYISYLDSVHFFRPKEYRTFVYHEILIGYLEFCKQNGFQTAHIWACPPGEGDDYIFHCHPLEQKIPKPKRLVEWYRNMLERGKEHSVLVDFQDIFQYCTEAEITTVTDIPYFEGDFWPNVIEETIKELDQEEEERKAVDDQQRGAGSNKKAGKRGTNKKGSKKAASRTKIGKKANPLVNGDDLTQKIYQTMDKHKEVFFVVYLQSPNQLSSPLPATTDPDSLVTCELMDGRDAFLNLAREKHWEFSSLRRAKFSTLSMLYELHNQGDRFVYCCNHCQTDVEFRWHCKECEDYDLCSTCYQKIGHEHTMEKLGFNMGDEDPKSSNNQQPSLSRAQLLKHRNEFLIHACQCRDATCSKHMCIKMKQLIRHTRECKMRTSGKCTACNFFLKMCMLHAQECRETKCPVPVCASLKQRMRERRQREQARSYELANRRIQAMNRSNASPTSTTNTSNTDDNNKPHPSPATPQTGLAPTPGKAVASPNPRTPGGPSVGGIPASPAPNPATPFIPPHTPGTPLKGTETGSPNVVVQPPQPQPPTAGVQPIPPQPGPGNVVSSNQEAINVHRLVTALSSSNPQANLKAKEYLKIHPEFVPRVINNLLMQGSEKAAQYLQQEFNMGGGMTSTMIGGPQIPQSMYPSRLPMRPHPNHVHPAAVAHYTNTGVMTAQPRMTHYAPHNMGHSTHPHLQHILTTRPQYPPYGGGVVHGGAPPPHYQMKPRPSMIYQSPSGGMMMQQPTMMRQMGVGPGGGAMINPQRLAMHQYRPPMDASMGVADSSMLHPQYPPPSHQYGPNTNSNNNNNLSSLLTPHHHYRTYYNTSSTKDHS